MSTSEVTDFSDMDMVLNNAENGKEDVAEKVPFDPNEYAGVVQWYNEQTQSIQQHYDTHFEYQKQKLAEENEAGLLEALQQSLDRFESDHLSDFTDLSSTLYPPHYCNTVPTTPTTTNHDLVEEPSMLKKLLLSPSNENYRKEVESPISSDCGSSFSCDMGNATEIASPARRLTPGQECDWKLGNAKKKKPFTELLRHMEATESPLAAITDVKKVSDNCTRLVNTMKYMRKYVPEPNSQESTPQKRISESSIRKVRSLKVMTSECTQLSQPLMSKATSVSTMLSPSNCGATKRRTTALTDPVPIKRSMTASHSNATDNVQSRDHDYCVSCSDTVLRQSTVAVACASTSDTLNHTNPVSSAGDSVKPGPKLTLTKVLKWEDYLHRVRAGTRSAPSSPQCSPKVSRGSACTQNNFMVVSMQEARNAVTSAGAARLRLNQTKKPPGPKVFWKQRPKLQGFEEYLKLLQKSSVVAAPVVSEVASASTTDSVESTDTPASNMLSSIARRKNNCFNMLLSKEVECVGEKSHRENPKMSEIDSELPHTNVSAPKTVTVKSSTISGNSGQVLMVHEQLKAARYDHPVSGSGLIAPFKVASSNAVRLDPRLNGSDRPCVPVASVKELKIPAMMMKLQGNFKKSSSALSQGPPAFKLMTSNKEGMETKSLILSDVRGQLKEILMLLAKQQAAMKNSNQKSLPFHTMAREEQQLTLQKLLSAISSLGSVPSDKAQVCVKSNALKIFQNVPKPVAVPTSQKPMQEVKRHPGINPKDVMSTCITPDKSTDEAKQEMNATMGGSLVMSPDSMRTTTTACAAKTEILVADCNGTMAAENPSSIKMSCNLSNLPTSTGECKVISDNNYWPALTETAATEPKNAPIPFVGGAASMTESSMVRLEHNCPAVLQNNVVSIKQNCLNSPELMTLKTETKEKMGFPLKNCGTASTDDLFPSMQSKSIEPDVGPNFSHHPMECNETMGQTVSLMKQDSVNIENAPAKFSMGRSMAATEMHATDVLDNGIEEILVYNKLENPKIAGGKGLNDVDSDTDLTSVPVGCASMKTDDMLDQGVPRERHDASSKTEDYKKIGLRNLTCDPMINAASNDVVEFDKLPHYFSSGKKSVARNGSSGVCGFSRLQSEPAVRFTTVGENQHLTPDGATVDASETYYSRLPTYYSYGRPYPAVRTFNDAVADDKDDTVTPELLESGDHQTIDSSRKAASLVVKKPEFGNQFKHTKKVKNNGRILYSKLPTYFTSGCALTDRRDRKRSSSPSARSSSSDSLYHSSGSSPKGPRSRRRRIRRSRIRESHGSREESGKSSDEEYVDRVRRKRDHHRRLSLNSREKKQLHAMEERRVVYVGRIEESMTKDELRLKFIRFGNIDAVSLHFRDDGDNYGFVTYQYTCDAFRAIEEGNNDLGICEKPYDLCFGGRRQFCRTAYEDLDSRRSSPPGQKSDFNDFDALLRQARRSIRK